MTVTKRYGGVVTVFVPGIQGTRGDKGNKGERGEKGEQGLPGVRGPAADLSNYYTKEEVDAAISAAISKLTGSSGE